MTHVDLLNFIIDVQNIPKNELAELIGVPQKKMDAVLGGAKPLKKKWLKNLSLFTGIPEQAILAGEFNLQYSVEKQESQVEGEQPPIAPEQTPEMVEALKDYNYERLTAFCKKRYKNRYDDILLSNFSGISDTIIGLIIIICCSALIFMQSPMTNIFALAFIGVIPVLLTVCATGLFKISKSGNISEEKNFKILSSFIFVGEIIFFIATAYFKFVPWWAMGIGFASILHPIYNVFFVGLKKQTSKGFIVFGAAVSLLLMGAFSFTILTGNLFEKAEEFSKFLPYMLIYYSSWICLSMAQYCVYLYCVYFKKVNNASKYFQPLPEKPVFKKHYIRNKIIALVLATVIFIFGTYTLSCAIIHMNVKSVTDSEDNPMPKYSDYNKSDITFTAEDDVVTIDNEYYTIKIPADMKKNKEIVTSDSYNSESKNCFVMMYDNGNIYGESLQKLFDNEETDERAKKAMGKLKQELIDTYGFYPQSCYELKKIIRDINENGVSFWNRKQGAAVLPIIIFDAVPSFGDEVIFYEDSEKEMVLCVHIAEFEDGRKSFICQVEGNKKGEYEKTIELSIMIRNDYADEELAYKIINSIEMK